MVIKKQDTPLTYDDIFGSKASVSWEDLTESQMQSMSSDDLSKVAASIGSQDWGKSYSVNFIAQAKKLGINASLSDLNLDPNNLQASFDNSLKTLKTNYQTNFATDTQSLGTTIQNYLSAGETGKAQSALDTYQSNYGSNPLTSAQANSYLSQFNSSIDAYNKNLETGKTTQQQADLSTSESNLQTTVRNYLANNDTTSAQTAIDTFQKNNPNVDISPYQSMIPSAGTTNAYSYNATTDTDFVNFQNSINSILAKGQPNFSGLSVTDPTTGKTYTGADVQSYYTSQWQNQLQTMQAPETQYYLDQLNKNVNNTYMAANPYSVGSGNQVTASQDATNQYLMSIASQQNAQAIALGQAQYNQDYATNWNKYLTDLGQYNAAQSGALQAANYATSANQFTSAQNQQSALAALENSYSLTGLAAQEAYGTQQANTANTNSAYANLVANAQNAANYQTQATTAADIASQYANTGNSTPWYDYLLQGAGSGIGQGIGKSAYALL
jgi:uncharacterized protein (DUF2147 family)